MYKRKKAVWPDNFKNYTECSNLLNFNEKQSRSLPWHNIAIILTVLWQTSQGTPRRLESEFKAIRTGATEKPKEIAENVIDLQGFILLAKYKKIQSLNVLHFQRESLKVVLPTDYQAIVKQ